MSAIESVGPSSLALLQQRLQRGAEAAPFDGPPPQVQSRFHSLAESAGLDPSGLGDLKDQIRSAVEAARGTDGSVDRAAMKDAVAGILKESGIDPKELRSKLQGMFQQAGVLQGARLQGFAGGGHAGTARQDALDALDALGAEDGAEATSGNTVSLLQLLENLPKGSLVNTAA